MARSGGSFPSPHTFEDEHDEKEADDQGQGLYDSNSQSPPPVTLASNRSTNADLSAVNLGVAAAPPPATHKSTRARRPSDSYLDGHATQNFSLSQGASEVSHFASSPDFKIKTKTEHTNPSPPFSHGDGNSLTSRDSISIESLFGSDTIGGLNDIEFSKLDCITAVWKSCIQRDAEQRVEIQNLKSLLAQMEQKDGMDKYALVDWMSKAQQRKVRQGWEAKLAEFQDQANIAISSEGHDSTTEESESDDGEDPPTPVDFSDQDVALIKEHILRVVNERDPGDSFAGLTTNREQNRSMLECGGFMWVLHVYFRGGFDRPKDASPRTRYVWTPWGAFEMKLRPFLVVNYGATTHDMCGHYCFTYGGREWGDLPQVTKNTSLEMVREEDIRDIADLRRRDIRVVNYGGTGPAYMSLEKITIDLRTPMRAGRGYVHPNDLQRLVGEFREFEEFDHNALLRAGAGRECRPIRFARDEPDPARTKSTRTTATKDALTDGIDRTKSAAKKCKRSGSQQQSSAKRPRLDFSSGSPSKQHTPSKSIDCEDEGADDLAIEQGRSNQKSSLTTLTEKLMDKASGQTALECNKGDQFAD